MARLQQGLTFPWLKMQVIFRRLLVCLLVIHDSFKRNFKLNNSVWVFFFFFFPFCLLLVACWRRQAEVWLVEKDSRGEWSKGEMLFACISLSIPYFLRIYHVLNMVLGLTGWTNCYPSWNLHHVCWVCVCMCLCLGSKNENTGTSLVVQWLRICLAVQGTRVRILVGELWSHMPQSSWACVLKLESLHTTTKDPACRS